MDLKEIVQHYQDVNRVSQAEIGRRTGLSKGYMSKLLRGCYREKISIETLEKLSKGLGLPLEEVVRAVINKDEETDTLLKDRMLDHHRIYTIYEACSDLNDKEVALVVKYVHKLRDKKHGK